jgi:protein-disulfide isomerase
LRERFEKTLRIVWRNFPLETHQHARPAANLAWHATQEADPELFWKLHDALFDNSEKLGPTTFLTILQQLKLDTTTYQSKVQSREYDQEIDADIELGQRIGVTGVPTLFINGRKVEGAHDFLTMAGLVLEEIEHMKHLSDAGYEPHLLDRTLCEPR